MNAYLSFLLFSVRAFRFPAVLTFSLFTLSCGGSDAPECRREQDCFELYGEGYACSSGGECFECGHIDPFGGPVQTPELWDPSQFVSGSELGLDPQRAYWEIPLAEYGLQNRPAPNPVWICDPMTLQDGEIVSMRTDECETLGPEDFIHESYALIVPVAPSAWLSSDPLNGMYYTEVTFEFGPIPDCP